MSILRTLLQLIIATALLGGTSFATGQDFPSKPVRIIVPNTPGTNADVLARMVSPALSEALGQPVVVENKPGAEGLIGLEYVAKAVPADGYTIVNVSVAQLALLPAIRDDLRFNPLKDLPPFIGYADAAFVFAVHSDTGWKTFDDFVAYARANPGKLNYGTSAPNNRLAMEAIVQAKGLDIVAINYPSGGPYLAAIYKNEIQMCFLGEAQANHDKIRVLAVSGASRNPAYPEIPTFLELGLPNLPSNKYTFNLPVGTPPAIVAKLRAAVLQSLARPDVQERLRKGLWTPITEPAEEATQYLAEQGALFMSVAKKRSPAK